MSHCCVLERRSICVAVREGYGARIVSKRALTSPACLRDCRRVRSRYVVGCCVLEPDDEVTAGDGDGDGDDDGDGGVLPRLCEE